MIFHAKCGSLWTTPWPDKNSIFLKIEKSKKSIFPIEIRTFYLWKLGGAFFLSQRLPTLRILHTKFGLIWTTSWPDKNDLFLKFLFREIQKVLYEILTFFLGNLHQKFFLFYILITLVIIQAEFGLIWTTPWPDEKDIFLKSLFGEIQKVPYEILNFFLGKLYQKFFLFYILITLVILHAEFGLIWTTPWPDKISTFFENKISE